MNSFKHNIMPLCHTTIEDSSLLLTNDVRHVTANQIKSVLLGICCPYFKPNMTILVANFCWKKRDHTIITSQAFRTIIFLCEGSPGIRNGGGKLWFWTPSWPKALFSFTKPYWASLSLTGPYLALLGLTGPYWNLLGLTVPYWALLGLTGPYWALLGLT